MSRNRLRTTNRGRLAAAVAIVGLLALVAAGGVAADESYAIISDASVSDDEPLPGERVVITPTIELSDGTDNSVKITSVSIRTPEGDLQGEYASEVGLLSAGDSIDVQVATSFENTGTKRVFVHAKGVEYDAEGDLVGGWDVRYPVHVEVVGAAEPEPDPRLRVEHEPLVAGHASTVNVTVSNGGEYAIRDLDVALRSDGSGVVAERHRYHPVLDGSTDRTFTFEVTPRGSGLTTLNATLDYEYGEQVVATDLANVAELREDVDVHAVTVTDNGTTSLQYRVTNRGNAPIGDVALSATADGAALPSAAVDRLDPASTATRRVALNQELSGAVEVSAAYDLDGDRATVRQSVDLGAESAGESATAATATPDAGAADAAAVGGGSGPLDGFDPLTSLVVGLGLGGVAVGAVRRLRTDDGTSLPRALAEEPGD
jgi:hypothetical protein